MNQPQKAGGNSNTNNRSFKSIVISGVTIKKSSQRGNNERKTPYPSGKFIPLIVSFEKFEKFAKFEKAYLKAFSQINNNNKNSTAAFDGMLPLNNNKNKNTTKVCQTILPPLHAAFDGMLPLNKLENMPLPCVVLGWG